MADFSQPFYGDVAERTTRTRVVWRRPTASSSRPWARGSSRLPAHMLTVMASLIVMLVSTLAHGEAINKATTSRAARDEAIRSLPMDQLTPAAREKINSVVVKPTLFRRMPLSLTNGDPAMHQFLIRNPEVVVNIWQLMGITKVTLKRTDNFAFLAADGMGTVANVELVYGDKDTHLYFCQGTYEGPMYPRPIKGNCVLLLETGVVPQDDGTNQVIDRLDVFLTVNNVGLDVLTRTLQPLVAKSADQNFIETTRFVERISRTAEKHGPSMENLAARLEQVSADRRQQFVSVSQAAYVAAQKRLAQGGPETTPAAATPADPNRLNQQLRR